MRAKLIPAGALVAALAGLSTLPALPAAAAERVLAAIDDLQPGEVEVRGFYLDRAQEVRIGAVGADRKWRFGRLGSAWILDAGGRRVVWEMQQARSRRHGRDLREYDARVHLGPGVYELYYAAVPEWGWSPDRGERSWWEEVLRDFMGAEDVRELVSELGVKVVGDGRPASEADLGRARRGLTDPALLMLLEVPDGTIAGRGFRLDRPLDLEIYGVGEIGERGGSDYGWIVDTATGQRVWTFTHANSAHAGGADRNRVVRETIHLPAGSYAAVFVTDTTHSPRGWYSPPPHDPAFWGLTVTVAEPAERRYASTFDYDVKPAGEVVAELTKVGSDRVERTGFTLSRPVEVRVWALGEGSGGEMYDYGWILDAKTRAKVWSMDLQRTEHAGGGQKNRLADERIRLPAGSYLVHYVTDGSHAWDDWNTEPPFDPERWGITLFAAGADFDRAAVGPYVEAAGGADLAVVAPVADDAHQRASFTLERPTRVAIYALGEGSGGEMYDYGWIEDAASGRIVWEMTYRATDRAGGAAKNRLYQGSLLLDPGRYTVHYRTDGSHAFDDWNAAPPADPESWGIRVSRAEDG